MYETYYVYNITSDTLKSLSAFVCFISISASYYIACNGGMAQG